MIAGVGLIGTIAVQIANPCGAIPLLVSDFDPARRESALRKSRREYVEKDKRKLIRSSTAQAGEQSIEAWYQDDTV